MVVHAPIGCRRACYSKAALLTSSNFAVQARQSGLLSTRRAEQTERFRKEGGSIILSAAPGVSSFCPLTVLAPRFEEGQAQFVEHRLPRVDQDHRISRFIDAVRGRLGEPRSLDILAEEFRTSRCSFVRHFKALTGTTVHSRLLAAHRHSRTRNYGSGSRYRGIPVAIAVRIEARKRQRSLFNSVRL